MARTGGIIACGEEVIHFRSDHLLLRIAGPVSRGSPKTPFLLHAVPRSVMGVRCAGRVTDPDRTYLKVGQVREL